MAKSKKKKPKLGKLYVPRKVNHQGSELNELSKLPTELRIKIYRFYIDDMSEGGIPGSAMKVITTMSSLPLLHTSKVIRVEALDVLCQGRQITIDSVRTLKQLIHFLGPYYASKIAVLHLSVLFWRYDFSSSHAPFRIPDWQHSSDMKGKFRVLRQSLRFHFPRSELVATLADSELAQLVAPSPSAFLVKLETFQELWPINQLIYLPFGRSLTIQVDMVINAKLFHMSNVGPISEICRRMPALKVITNALDERKINSSGFLVSSVTVLQFLLMAVVS